MHFLIEHLVSQVMKIILRLFRNLFLVSQNQRSSALKQYVDNFRRQESTAWLLSSEKQQDHRPISEQIENNRGNRLRALSNDNDVFKNRRQATTIG
jgi:hypothetical protein